MKKIKMNIWGRSFNLDVYFEKFQNEQVTKLQEEAFEDFISVKNICDSSLDDLKRYIFNNYREYLKEEEISNIFKYVIPGIVFVPKKEKKVVAVLCDFKFDMEHGIALVYENEKFIKVVTQDAVL